MPAAKTRVMADPAIKALAASGVFSSLTPDALAEVVARGTLRSFAPGEVLMRQGQEGDSMHVIVQGHVAVERGHPDIAPAVLLAELGTGDCVGEMAALEPELRSATVTAIEPTVTLEISGETLPGVLLQHPQAALAMLHMLIKRLRRTNAIAALAADHGLPGR